MESPTNAYGPHSVLMECNGTIPFNVVLFLCSKIYHFHSWHHWFSFKIILTWFKVNRGWFFSAHWELGLCDAVYSQILFKNKQNANIVVNVYCSRYFWDISQTTINNLECCQKGQTLIGELSYPLTVHFWRYSFQKYCGSEFGELWKN